MALECRINCVSSVRCNDERHQIVEEQRLLAERLEQIDANERTEEQAVREKNNRKLEEVRILLSQLRQKMSLEGYLLLQKLPLCSHLQYWKTMLLNLFFTTFSGRRQIIILA